MASRKRKNLSGDDLKAEEEFESKLIGIVLLYPILWDMGHSEYKKQVLNGAVWEKIGKELGKSKDDHSSTSCSEVFKNSINSRRME
uniref:MADF domain-containing protein n=1 Tax=Ditylenchus dipsaci TaxID=166011 RepID=A0A915E8D6_9BILA